MRREREEAADFVSDLLAYGPVTAKEVYRLADEAGITRRTLHRAKKKLGVIAAKEKGGMNGGWAWRLPPKVANNGEGCHNKSVVIFGESGNLRDTGPPSAGDDGTPGGGVEPH